MTKNEFLAELAGILDVDPGALTPETELQTLEAWDSVSALATMVMIDEKLGTAIRPEKLTRASTVGDILAAVNSTLNA